MKKRSLIFLGVGLLTVAAVGTMTQLLTQETVSAWSDVVDCYYDARTGIPPIPSSVAYTDVFEMMSTNDWSFLSSDMWSFYHSGGTLYVADESALAQTLQLPMEIAVYEDLQLNEVVILGSTNGVDYVGLALFDAPEWMAYQAGDPLEKYLMDELGPRRIIWSATLKSEDSMVTDLFASQTASMSVQSLSALTMTTASSSEAITDFRLIQNETNRLFLSVNLPDEFAGSTLELYSRSTLVDGVWTNVLQTNAASSGVMELGEVTLPDMPCEITITTNAETIYINPIDGSTNVIPAGVYTNYEYSSVTAFFKVTAVSQLDSDADGLGNLAEYELGTDYLDLDSDDDGLLDGEEVGNGQDPLTANGIPDEFETGMQSASNGVFVVLPERCWHAQESSLNLETYGAYGEE